MTKNFPHIPERIAGLGELAYNLWWSWNPVARMLFKTLDRQAWKECVHNPVRMLKEIPTEILESAADNSHYLKQYDRTMTEFNHYMGVDNCWFTENITGSACLPVAYFSAEYGLHHSLPFYAGGLGFLAGDHIKECSDLGIPLVAIGFMYPEGYFRQRIRIDGWQESVNETLDRDVTPITRVSDQEGEQLVVKIPFTDPPIHVALWTVDVGRVTLYLMDTDIEINVPRHRTISSQLYVGDVEHRLLQELVLGIGGSEVLRAVGIDDYLLHLNEGHTSFALLERVRTQMEKGMSYDDAVQYSRKTSIFTTHTPVPAGIDVFPLSLIDKYFSSYYSLLGVGRESFFRLGLHPGNPSAGFNMAVLALSLTAHHNGVSKKHGEVARQMWQPLWPQIKEQDVPIDYITNGVHVPTWLEPKMEILLNKHLSPGWKQRHDSPDVWKAVDDIPNRDLWQVYMWMKTKLVNKVRELARKKWVKEEAEPLKVISGGTLLDPLTLTIGFARRFATYKRAYLIFSDLERLKRIVNNRWRPIQIIFAGKAHPADDEGKRVLQQVFTAACDPSLGGHIAFIENYDEQLAQYLVHGVDVWLNNPVPPMEASGTSGMKAALNGVPQLSILDGWWMEGYNGKNGWAFEGSGSDTVDAESIYNLLEHDVIPLYYNQDEDGVPHGWVKLMKESIKSAGAAFSARRMVKEYALKFYKSALKEV
ncbi:MAG: alpha-glucan family phosphorylase [Candidatus Scalindua sp. AMX11]|nr:MAG: alpha-glucan family phosphorylase [Candidatus Scalindua sp.]NOG84672.1 alpha-glucan family phosphorylase [Planctomycetota bacterium]RZV92443.1 MAG: alpha-glucan family phosphorylase [Candidatus Scalindua sp. SCAELEC01]TDE66028.1 MAG: alpha-glucan family phosphorylase [Candidatus Scalindua sp. AMX11]GJQ58999.1 MAG: glycogen phosphorylase [Candidatus Scalindua sp.]